MSVTLVASKVVTPDGVLSPWWVRCEGEVIVKADFVVLDPSLAVKEVIRVGGG